MYFNTRVLHYCTTHTYILDTCTPCTQYTRVHTHMYTCTIAIRTIRGGHIYSSTCAADACSVQDTRVQASRVSWCHTRRVFCNVNNKYCNMYTFTHGRCVQYTHGHVYTVYWQYSGPRSSLHVYSVLDESARCTKDASALCHCTALVFVSRGCLAYYCQSKHPPIEEPFQRYTYTCTPKTNARFSSQQIATLTRNKLQPRPKLSEGHQTVSVKRGAVVPRLSGMS